MTKKHEGRSSVTEHIVPTFHECVDHQWQPISMVFESQLLDKDGRVLIRQPDLVKGRVYLVCLACARHTYMSTSWAGHRLYGSEDRAGLD